MDWIYRGHNLGNSVSISAISFDPELELLWAAEQYGTLSSYTTTHSQSSNQGSDSTPPQQSWSIYSSIRATSAQPPRHIGFLGSGANTMVTVADREVIRSFKRGGVSVMYLPLPEGTQPFIQQFQVSQPESTIYYSGSRGLTQLKLGDGCTPASYSVAYDASNGIENISLYKSNVVTGMANGAVMVRDARDLSIITQITPMRTAVRATAMLDHTLMVAYTDRPLSSSPTSVIKIFDLRKVSSNSSSHGGNGASTTTVTTAATATGPTGSPPTATTSSFPSLSSSISGGPEPLYSVDLPTAHVLAMQQYSDHFSTQKALSHRAVVLTPRTFYMMNLNGGDAPTLSPTMLPDGEGTCAAISPSSTCAAVGLDRGYFSTYGHPLSRTDFIMANFEQPPRPQPPGYLRHWSDSSIRTGFDEKVPEESLSSSWPPPNYMILTVPQKLHCVEKGDNVPGALSVPNQWDLHRSDSYLTDRKDNMASRIPNPYPFNTQLGDDLLKAQQILLELRKTFKRKAKSASNRVGVAGGTGTTSGTDEYGTQEPIQVYYSSHHKDVWKEVNKIPHKVIGTDNSCPESWIGGLLQCLFLCQPPYFPIRKIILRHLCSRQYCVTCEISFIFSNMLMVAASQQAGPDAALPPVVQIFHLLRTMGQFREFDSVFERPQSREDAVAKVHACQRALLKMLNKDLLDQRAYPFLDYGPPSPDYVNSIASLFGTHCESNNGAHKIDPRFYWEVPDSALKVDEGLEHLLKETERSQEKVQIKELPKVIVLLLNPEHSHLKPPYSLKITRSNGEDYIYYLTSNIIHLAEDVDDVGNFVSHHRIQDELFTLVNDYRVTVPMLSRDLEQMVPALRSCTAIVSYYALSQLTSPEYALEDEDRPPNMWHVLGRLLLHDIFAVPLQRDRAQQRFQSPLRSYQDIRSGVLVAIDAEYIVLKWAKRSDEPETFPTSSSARKHMALARVSCIMSSEPGDEVTIMDDYVHTPEEIEDYVTQFSGIRAGDLDALRSTKCLTALKATYLKLRALVDAGVVFVGHGLSQDFRVCNIAVPKRQIIDTLLIFHKPGSRYMSLRFLALHLLGEKVQEKEHDSIEDARTSLRLYRAYQKLKEANTFEKTLDQLLEKGAETNWYVPSGSRSTHNSSSYIPNGKAAGNGITNGMNSLSLSAGNGDESSRSIMESQNLSLNSPVV